MPSIINSTTTNGVTVQGDNSGSLQLATNNGTTAVTIDTSQNVGIGTSSPSQKLAVAGGVASTAGISALAASTAFFDFNSGNARFAAVSGTTGTAAPITLSQYSSNGSVGRDAVTINSSGDLLVGTITTAANGKLEVRNNSGIVAYFYNNAGTGLYLGAGGTSWTVASDERLKTQLIPFQDAVHKISTLRSGTGRYLTDDETVSRSFLIAQDVQKVLPEAVDERDDEAKTLGVRYTEVIPLLVAAIQELKAELDATKAEVQALKGVA